MYSCVFSANADETKLNTVQVNAYPTETSFTPHDFIGSHDSIDLRKYNEQFIEFEELLSQQAGIDIQSVSGIGQYATPIIRGAEGQQVLVFNNGTPLNSLNGGSADIGSVSLIGADRIDIYRGMIPMELSPTAIGGAINIINSPSYSNSGEASHTVGTYGIQQTALSQEVSHGRYSFKINAEHLTANNNFIYLEQQPVTSPSSPKNEPRYNNQVEQRKISTSFNIDINSSHTLTGNLTYENNTRNIAGKINSKNNSAYIDDNKNRFQIRHLYKYNHNANFTSEYLFSNSIQTYNDIYSTVGLGSQHNKYDSGFQKVNLTYQQEIDKIKIILNQQFQYESVKNYYLNDSNSSSTECWKNLQCDGRFIRQQTSSGGRLEWQILPSTYTSIQVSHLTNRDDAFSNTTEKNNEDFFSAIAGVSYRFKNGLKLTSNFSKQIRPPSTSELYGDRGTTNGNPALNAEKSNSLELGILYSSSLLDMSVFSFFRNVNNNISAQQDSRGIIKYLNIAKTRYKGIELSLSSQINRLISYTGNLSLQEGLILKHDLHSLIGNNIGDHRAVFLNQSMTYKINRWSIALENTLERGGYFDNQNLLKRRHKNNWNILLSTTWKDLSASLQFVNFSNQRVRDFPQSPVSGRTFFFKIKQSWSL